MQKVPTSHISFGYIKVFVDSGVPYPAHEKAKWKVFKE